MLSAYRLLPLDPKASSTAVTRRLRDLTKKRSKGALASLLAALILLAFITSIQSYSFVPGTEWDGSFEDLRRGWVAADRVGGDGGDPGFILEAAPPVASTLTFSEQCSELWVANGVLCPELEGKGDELFDVVYTYTNGSDPFLRSWREFSSRRVGQIPYQQSRQGKGGVAAGSLGNSYSAQKQFR